MFRLTEYRLHYRGQGQHRKITQLQGLSQPEKAYDPHLMLGELPSSIDFTNILFVVSFGLLALVAWRLDDFPAVAALLSMVVSATFFSLSYYAVVEGNVARLAR